MISCVQKAPQVYLRKKDNILLRTHHHLRHKIFRRLLNIQPSPEKSSTTNILWFAGLVPGHFRRSGSPPTTSKSFIPTCILNAHLICRNRTQVAVKILTADYTDGEEVGIEIDMMRTVRDTNPAHPGYMHVSQMLDHFLIVGPEGPHVCLVMEVMRGTVEHLRPPQPDSDLGGALLSPLIRQIVRDALLGLSYLHACGIVHTGILLPPGVELHKSWSDLHHRYQERQYFLVP